MYIYTNFKFTSKCHSQTNPSSERRSAPPADNQPCITYITICCFSNFVAFMIVLLLWDYLTL